MKRILLAVSFVIFHLSVSTAQTRMQIKMNDGGVTTIPVDSILDIQFQQQAPASFEGLTGQWLLIAANNGVTGADGISRSTTDTIRFTATLSADATRLECQTDRLYWRSGQDYPADFAMIVEQNGNQRRIGWVLTKEQPVSSKEFLETSDKYLEDGFFYWANQYGDQDNGHRYIYLLSENIETQRLEGMTLWSSWLDQSATTFSFPQNQQVYAVAAMQIPYAQSVGYIEIWASVRFEKEPDMLH